MKIKEILVILLCSFTLIGFGQTKLDKIEKKYVDIIKLSENWINENFNFRSGKYNGIHTIVHIYKDENIDILLIKLETTGNSRDRIECLINKKSMTYIIKPGLYGISDLWSTMDKKKYFIDVINQKEGYYSVGLFDILNKRLVIQPKFNDFSATSENRIYKENAQMMNISKTTLITYKDKENNEYTYNLTNNKITQIPINHELEKAKERIKELEKDKINYTSSNTNANPCENAKIPKYDSYAGWVKDGSDFFKDLGFSDGINGGIKYYPNNQKYLGGSFSVFFDTEQEAIKAEYLYRKYGCK